MVQTERRRLFSVREIFAAQALDFFFTRLLSEAAVQALDSGAQFSRRTAIAELLETNELFDKNIADRAKGVHFLEIVGHSTPRPVDLIPLISGSLLARRRANSKLTGKRKL